MWKEWLLFFFQLVISKFEQHEKTVKDRLKKEKEEREAEEKRRKERLAKKKAEEEKERQKNEDEPKIKELTDEEARQLEEDLQKVIKISYSVFCNNCDDWAEHDMICTVGNCPL